MDRAVYRADTAQVSLQAIIVSVAVGSSISGAVMATVAHKRIYTIPRCIDALGDRIVSRVHKHVC